MRLHHLAGKKIDESEFCFHVSRRGFALPSNEIGERDWVGTTVQKHRHWGRDLDRHRGEQVRFKKERRGISEWMLAEHDNEWEVFFLAPALSCVISWFLVRPTTLEYTLVSDLLSYTCLPIRISPLHLFFFSSLFTFSKREIFIWNA